MWAPSMVTMQEVQYVVGAEERDVEAGGPPRGDVFVSAK